MKRLRESLGVIWAIFTRDLKKLVRNPVAMIITIGVIFLPSVYAWATIGADWDPYGQTGNLKVGFANQDQGAENALIGKLNVGDEVEQELRENHSLGWQFVDEKQALQGVESGEYYAAIVIPAEFSRDFLKVLDGQITEPEIKYYVNEKISATAPEFTDTGAETVEKEIDSQFTATVSKAVVELAQKAGIDLSQSAATMRGTLSEGITEAKELTAEVSQAIAELEPAVTAAKAAGESARQTVGTLQGALPGLETDLGTANGQLKGLRTRLGEFGAAGVQATTKVETLLATMIETTEELQRKLGELAGSVGGSGELTGVIENLKAELNGLTEELKGLETETSKLTGEFSTGVVGNLENSLDSFADATAAMQGAVSGVEPILGSSEAALAQLSTTLDVAEKAMQGVKTTLDVVDGSLTQAQADLDVVASSEGLKKFAQLLGVNPEEISEFMAAPVTLKTETIYPIKNYGTGVAPFFTNIAMWVAGFILVAIFHLTVDPKGLPKFTVTQAYLGRLMLFVLIGILQGLVVCVGDLVLGIQCANPAAFIFAGVATIVVDVNIMYALVFTMRHLGRAIGVVLLIMQIPGASGEYPVQMMPEFFQVLHPWLPFTYSIDAMREATGGMYGANYWLDILRLLPFLVLALAFGLIAGRHAFNLNALFDKELSETDLLITERKGSVVQKYRLRPVLAILLKDKGYRKMLLARAERFQRRYPTMVKIGWGLMLGIPIGMVMIGMVLPRSADIRLVLLLLMVVGILATGAYLISVEFINYGLKNQLKIGENDGKNGRNLHRDGTEKKKRSRTGGRMSERSQK